jgi:hypothetical protein
LALPYLVPPSATVLVRRRFVKGEPLRPAEAILADLIERHADTPDDLFADPLSSLPFADLLDRGIAEPLEKRVATPWPEAIQRLVDKCDVEFRVVGIKDQTLAALQCVEVGRAAAAGPYCLREIRTNAAAVNRRLRRTIPVRTIRRWWRTIPVRAVRRCGLSNTHHIWQKTAKKQKTRMHNTNLDNLLTIFPSRYHPHHWRSRCLKGEARAQSKEYRCLLHSFPIRGGTIRNIAFLIIHGIKGCALCTCDIGIIGHTDPFSQSVPGELVQTFFFGRTTGKYGIFLNRDSLNSNT